MTAATEPSRERVALSGVSETALLTLNSRAREARRQKSIIDDPLAIALVDSIDFDFAKFGRTHQVIALRARAFDTQARAYLGQHPSATVVALAEGLQTSF
jgi:O-methyltransferase involved in polyketide biosynthesis